MNGRDADLDHGGQMHLKSLQVVDPTGKDKMRVLMELYLYASICEPNLPFQDNHYGEDGQLTPFAQMKEEEAMEQACHLVKAEFDYSGEWTGSDYWTFSHTVKTFVEISVDEYAAVDNGSEETLQAIAQRLMTELRSNQEVKDFEHAMEQLAKRVARIAKHI